MAVEVGGVGLIGLPVVNEEDDAMLGTVANVSAGEDGRLAEICCRLRWRTGERCLPASDIRLVPNAVMTSRTREELNACPTEGACGVVGVEVRAHTGEALGKVTDVVVEPEGLNVVGLELSNGLVRDWAKGRSLVILHPAEDLGGRSPGYITLSEEARTISTREDRAGDSSLPGIPTAIPGIDWKKVRSLSEENIRKQMARTVWERRGSPGDDGEGKAFLDLVAPWAADLKKAAKECRDEPFQDVALMTGDQVEALRPFRLGADAIQRGAPTEHPEATAA